MGCACSNEVADPVFSPEKPKYPASINQNDINFTIPAQSNEKNSEVPKIISYCQTPHIVAVRIEKLNVVINELKKTKLKDDFLKSLLVEKANYLFSVGAYKQAIQALSQAVQIWKSIGIDNGKIINYIGMYNNIGVCWGKLKKKKLARKQLIEGLNLYFQFIGTTYHAILNVLLGNLALYLRKKKIEDKESKQKKQSATKSQLPEQKNHFKEKSFKKQVIRQKPLEEQEYQLHHVRVEKSLNPKINKELLKELGLHEFIEGEYDSLKIFETLLKFAQSENQDCQKDILTAKIYHNIANHLSLSGDYRLSKLYFQKAQDLKNDIFKTQDNYEIASTKLALGNCHIKLGNYKEGFTLMGQALSIVCSLGYNNHKTLAETLQKYFFKNVQYILKKQSDLSLQQEKKLAIAVIEDNKLQEHGLFKEALRLLANFKKQNSE